MALVVVALLQVTTAGHAQAPQAQGWWWAMRDLGLPVEVPAPADVPEDGIYVSSNPTGDEAVSALMFVIPEGSTATTLTLKAAGAIAGTAEIQVCPTFGGWQPAQGGSWPSRPKYACPEKPVLGVVSPDGATVSFPLGALGSEQLIDVALVPVAGTSFRAAFAKPDPQALAVRVASTPSGASDTAAPVPEPQPSPGVVVVPEPAAAPATFFASDFSSSVQPLPQVAAEPVIGAAPQLGLASRGIPLAQPASGGYDRMQTVGMFGLILVAALWSRYSTQQQRPPRSLVNFGLKSDVEMTGEVGA